MRFARWTFGGAAIYGLILLIPFYLLEVAIGRSSPPPISHPEYFYGFVGASCVMQLVYLAIATDPMRYRPLMPIGALAKLAFFVPTFILFRQGRAPAGPLLFSTIDLCLGVLFVIAFFRTPKPDAAKPMAPWDAATEQS